MKKFILALAATIAFAGSAAAFGPHDNNCVECHSLHYAKGAAIIGVEPKVAEANPVTGASIRDDRALCLGCHNDDEGIMPIFLKSTHPVGMKPKNVKVPAELLRPDGSLGCTSCHDPHPSNPNYKYLEFRGEKLETSGKLGLFCAMCHQEKVDMAEFAPKKAAQ